MNKKGSILMIALWVLAILVIFSIGIGHRAAIALRLSRFQRDSLKANLIASGAVNQAIALTEQDELDTATKEYDTLGECGVNLKENKAEEIFSSNSTKKNESFATGYKNSAGEFIFGLEDETGRININGTRDLEKYKILELLKSAGVENTEAEELKNAIIEWMKPGAFAKKDLFSRPEELLLVFEYFYLEKKGLLKAEAKKKAQELFAQIKDLFTIYGDGKVNFNTASEKVLSILVKAVAKAHPDPENPDSDAIANSLIPKLFELREQPKKNINEIAILGLPAGEQNILTNLTGSFISVKSNYFRISSTAKINNISKSITAVYERDKNKLVYWRQN